MEKDSHWRNPWISELPWTFEIVGQLPSVQALREEPCTYCTPRILWKNVNKTDHTKAGNLRQFPGSSSIQARVKSKFAGSSSTRARANLQKPGSSLIQFGELVRESIQYEPEISNPWSYSNKILKFIVQIVSVSRAFGFQLRRVIKHASAVNAVKVFWSKIARDLIEQLDRVEFFFAFRPHVAPGSLVASRWLVRIGSIRQTLPFGAIF